MGQNNYHYTNPPTLTVVIGHSHSTSMDKLYQAYSQLVAWSDRTECNVALATGKSALSSLRGHASYISLETHNTAKTLFFI